MTLLSFKMMPLRQSANRSQHAAWALLALALLLGVGALVAAAVPDDASPWLSMAAYLAPACVAFVVRWWMDQDG